MERTVLETQQVTKIYRSNEILVRAVDDVSIQVEAGEFIALVGPSGSGKTTMLAMLASLLVPTEGSVLIDGEPLGDMTDRQRTKFRREKIGFTFQSNNLIPYLTSIENVELMLRLNGKRVKQRRGRAKEILVRLGLDAQLNQLPSQLSAGQQQRVAIARSLIHNPSLVLADEPTANLDTARAHQVVQNFSDLIHEERHAGIMVTHDLRMCKYVDRVIQMVDGKISHLITSQEEISVLSESSEFDILEMGGASMTKKDVIR
ncbi:MAG: ABC transporter ATP-binding protein [Anaerolineales bacterium]|nr:ABC transporter ATP-binding protein [Anaerolineales bacterium]